MQHGIGFTKGCASPVKIGDPYSCSFSIRNNLDEAEDTLTINGLVDVVHSSGGNVSSGNIFSTVKLDSCSTSTASVSDGRYLHGAGPDRHGHARGSVDERDELHPAVRVAHQRPELLALHGRPGRLRTARTISCAMTRSSPGTTSATTRPEPQTRTATRTPRTRVQPRLAVVLQLVSATTTDIHNANHQVVTSVDAGSTVHDLVTVTGQTGSAAPSGNVTIDWFTNNTCTGTPASNSGPVGPLVANGSTGTFDATGFAKGPLAAGLYAFQAHYAGDATYAGSDGPCEPLQVTQLQSSTTTDIHNAAHADRDGGRGGLDRARLRHGDRSAGQARSRPAT